MGTVTFRNIPQDVNIEMCKFLPFLDVLSFALTCKASKQTSDANRLWEHFKSIYLPGLLFKPELPYKPQFLKAIGLLRKKIQEGKSLQYQIPGPGSLPPTRLFHRVMFPDLAKREAIVKLIADQDCIFAVSGYAVEVLRQASPNSFFSPTQRITLSMKEKICGDEGIGVRTINDSITCAGVNNRFLVVGTALGSVLLLARTKETLSKESHEILGPSLAPPTSLCCKNHSLSVGFKNGTVKIWRDVEKEPSMLQCHEADVEGIDFNGIKLITASKRTLKIWYEVTGAFECKKTIDTGCDSAISQMIVTGNRVMVLFQKGNIKAWASDPNGDYQLKWAHCYYPYSTPVCDGPLNFLFLNHSIHQIITVTKEGVPSETEERLQPLKQFSHLPTCSLIYHQGSLMIGHHDGAITIKNFSPTDEQLAEEKGRLMTSFWSSLASYFLKRA